MKNHTGSHLLYYPRLDDSRLSLTGVFDSSHKSVDSKYAQGAYIILLGERGGDRSVGYEKCHVLEFSPRKNTRVAKSSFAAEILAGNRCSELFYRIGQWLVEMEK